MNTHVSALFFLQRELEEKDWAWKWEWSASCWHGSLGTSNTKTWGNESVPPSDIVANAVKLCEQHVYMCMCVAPSAFMYKRLYLSCNSSLQTPAAASGQVCGCPRLPWAQSSSRPYHCCFPHCSHLSVKQSPAHCNICILHLYSHLGLWVDSLTQCDLSDCKTAASLNLNLLNIYGITCLLWSCLKNT